MRIQCTNVLNTSHRYDNVIKKYKRHAWLPSIDIPDFLSFKVLDSCRELICKRPVCLPKILQLSTFVPLFPGHLSDCTSVFHIKLFHCLRSIFYCWSHDLACWPGHAKQSTLHPLVIWETVSVASLYSHSALRSHWSAHIIDQSEWPICI